MPETASNGKDTARRVINYDAKAYRSLQQARKLRDGQEWAPDSQAEFLLQQANVFALLELADAIRSQSKS
jgi:hypothetical protein